MIYRVPLLAIDILLYMDLSVMCRGVGLYVRIHGKNGRIALNTSAGWRYCVSGRRSENN